MTETRPAIILVVSLVVQCATMPVNGDDREDQTLPGPITITDPDGDCQIKSTITVTVPNTNHDLHPKLGMNAPRLLQTVSGDFTAQVKVTGDFQPGDMSTGGGRPFNGAGLLIWQDESNYLRLERNAYRVGDRLMCFPPLIEYWADKQYRGVNTGSVPADEFFQGRSTWLKLQRQGDQFTASFSHDGDEWTVAREFTAEFPDEVSVGMDALNTSNEEFTVEFEAFEITTDDVPDPAASR